jgi:hypothetical protein
MEWDNNITLNVLKEASIAFGSVVGIVTILWFAVMKWIR